MRLGRGSDLRKSAGGAWRMQRPAREHSPAAGIKEGEKPSASPPPQKRSSPRLAQYLVNLFGVHIHDVVHSSQVRGVAGKGEDVVTGEVLE